MDCVNTGKLQIGLCRWRRPQTCHRQWGRLQRLFLHTIIPAVNQAPSLTLGSLIYCGLLRWPPFRRLLPILIDLCDVTLSFLSSHHDRTESLSCLSMMSLEVPLRGTCFAMLWGPSGDRLRRSCMVFLVEIGSPNRLRLRRSPRKPNNNGQ